MARSRSIGGCSQKPPSNYLRDEYARMLALIEEAAGRPVADDDLRASLDVLNENRRLLRHAEKRVLGRKHHVAREYEFEAAAQAPAPDDGQRWCWRAEKIQHRAIQLRQHARDAIGHVLLDARGVAESLSSFARCWRRTRPLRPISPTGPSP